MKRGDITIKILETIAAGAALSIIGLFEAFGAILNSGYGASYGKMRKEISKSETQINRKEDKQRYYNILYKLKKSGLIEEEVKNNKKFFHITVLGKKKLAALKNKQKLSFPETRQFKKEDSDKFTIVIFDIPEREKRKRHWLRSVLKNIGMAMVQKSVWIGKVKVPKDLVDYLYDLKIIEFVEIFEITKTGSLKNIV